MDPDAILANLAPLRDPPPIGWWPLAPGWWVLAAALALLVITGIALWLRQRRRNRYRRQAEKHLRQLIQQGTVSLIAINRLLKATALRAWPPEEVAAIHGEQWLDFLRGCHRGSTPTDFAELAAVYSEPEAPATDALVKTTESWIRQHRVSHD